jgi:hypothetical protein
MWVCGAVAVFGFRVIGFLEVGAAVVNANGISLEFPGHQPRVAAGSKHLA